MTGLILFPKNVRNSIFEGLRTYFSSLIILDLRQQNICSNLIVTSYCCLMSSLGVGFSSNLIVLIQLILNFLKKLGKHEWRGGLLCKFFSGFHFDCGVSKTDNVCNDLINWLEGCFLRGRGYLHSSCNSQKSLGRSHVSIFWHLQGTFLHNYFWLR